MRHVIDEVVFNFLIPTLLCNQKDHDDNQNGDEDDEPDDRDQDLAHVAHEVGTLFGECENEVVGADFVVVGRQSENVALVPDVGVPVHGGKAEGVARQIVDAVVEVDVQLVVQQYFPNAQSDGVAVDFADDGVGVNGVIVDGGIHYQHIFVLFLLLAFECVSVEVGGVAGKDDHGAMVVGDGFRDEGVRSALYGHYGALNAHHRARIGEVFGVDFLVKTVGNGFARNQYFAGKCDFLRLFRLLVKFENTQKQAADDNYDKCHPYDGKYVSFVLDFHFSKKRCAKVHFFSD